MADIVDSAKTLGALRALVTSSTLGEETPTRTIFVDAEQICELCQGEMTAIVSDEAVERLS